MLGRIRVWGPFEGMVMRLEMGRVVDDRSLGCFLGCGEWFWNHCSRFSAFQFLFLFQKIPLRSFPSIAFESDRYRNLHYCPVPFCGFDNSYLKAMFSCSCIVNGLPCTSIPRSGCPGPALKMKRNFNSPEAWLGDHVIWGTSVSAESFCAPRV